MVLVKDKVEIGNSGAAPNLPALKSQPRYSILDALRIILALWVTMSHFGVFPLFAGADTATKFGRTLIHGWSSIVWGVPAVIGFFVISGFCIHLPYRHDEKLPVGRYYARRYIRILVPVAVAILISRLIKNNGPIIGQHSVLWNGVLWSLACEEIYYAVYPLARVLRKRFGWGPVLGPAFLVGAILAFTRPEALDGSALGTVEAAVSLFPVWLLGCILAEQSDQLPALDSPWVIWGWRFLAWFGSWCCEMIHFKGEVSVTQSVLWFGILAYFWIKKEIAYSKHHQPWTQLASAGLWSYSLYLMHIPAMGLLEKLPMSSLGYILDWCVSIAFIMGISYLFYLSVERPSHRLARRIMVITGPETRASDDVDASAVKAGHSTESSSTANP
jgi:peptidoglycan/LPS O-acetylase OafA/YrhL